MTDNKIKRESRITASTIADLPLPIYLSVLLLTILCMTFDCLPSGMVPAFFVLMVLGECLSKIGNTLPLVRTYLGGSVLCVLGAAIIRAAGLIPAATLETMNIFVNDSGFLVFYIAALISGSLFNIDRNLLLRATVRLLPVALTAVACGMLVAGIFGILLGDGFLGGVLFIGIPMTSGGMTAGTVPLSGVYADALGGSAGDMLTRMAPATVLGNCVAIVFGGIANNLGDRRPAITGQGMLVNDGTPPQKQPPLKPTTEGLCAGLLVSLALYQLAAFLHHFVPIIPTYAWMIVATVVVKSLRVLPEKIEDSAKMWGSFSIHTWTAAALSGIGFTLIDLSTILRLLTPLYLLAVLAVVVTITAVAALLGKKVGFYPLESAIAAGMCTTNMGGSGNVAVLCSAKRMELLPFAQIVTRSCGALMLTLGGMLIHLLA